MFEVKDSAVVADQRMTGYTGLRAAMEARLVGPLSLEELDNHEPFSRPVFAWRDTENEVAPGPNEEWFENDKDRHEVHGETTIVQGRKVVAYAYGNSPDLVGWDAIDQRLSEELAGARRSKCEEARVQWATDKVSRAFFQTRTQADLDEAFALLSSTKERNHVAQGIIQMAVQRVVRLEREGKQAYLDNLRELNRRMSEWAQGIGYRVKLDGEQAPVARAIRDQAWCLVELRPGIGQVCRGKNVGGKFVVMTEPEIFGLAAQA